MRNEENQMNSSTCWSEKRKRKWIECQSGGETNDRRLTIGILALFVNAIRTLGTGIQLIDNCNWFGHRFYVFLGFKYWICRWTTNKIQRNGFDSIWIFDLYFICLYFVHIDLHSLANGTLTYSTNSRESWFRLFLIVKCAFQLTLVTHYFRIGKFSMRKWRIFIMHSKFHFVDVWECGPLHSWAIAFPASQSVWIMEQCDHRYIVSMHQRNCHDHVQTQVFGPHRLDNCSTNNLIRLTFQFHFLEGLTDGLSTAWHMNWLVSR